MKSSMRFGKWAMISCLAVALSFGIMGCEEDDNTVVPPEEFAPPTNLKALSLDGQVRLTWTASPSASGSSFAGYRVIARNANGIIVDSVQTGASITTYTVSNLTNGQRYTFSVRSVKTGGGVSTEILIEWGPTKRFAAARIYEFESSNPSGLQFSTGQTFAFKSSNPDNRGNIDLWIDGRNNQTPLLKSPDDEDFASSGWRKTLLAETQATGLDQQVEVPSSGSFRNTPGVTIAANKVFFAKTQEGNYVRFTVSAVQGSSPNRYVDVTIAYNSGTGAWAKK